MTGTISPTLPVAGEPNSTADPKVLGSLKTLRDEINALLNSENKVPSGSLAAGAALGNLAEKSITASKIAAELTNNNLSGSAGITDANLNKPIISGSLNEAGAVGAGTGFTAEKTGTGIYKVTLSTELATKGHMMTTLHGAGGFIYVQEPSKKVFEIRTFDTSTVAKNMAFGFLVKAS